jgi:hypothetical protein
LGEGVPAREEGDLLENSTGYCVAEKSLVLFRRYMTVWRTECTLKAPRALPVDEDGLHLAFSICQHMFINLFNKKGLSWYFTDAISIQRLVKDTLQRSLLDQVLFTNDALVNNCEILSPLGRSDHKCVYVELGVSADKNAFVREKHLKLSWSKIASKDLLTFSLNNIDWSFHYSSDNVEDMWGELYGKLKSSKLVVLPLTAEYLESCRLNSFTVMHPRNITLNDMLLSTIANIALCHDPYTIDSCSTLSYTHSLSEFGLTEI